MGVSLFSRFQGCLLMTFLATGNKEGINEAAITANLESWATIFHSHPYQGTIPATVWQGDEPPWQTLEEFWQWLIVLALWHHENPVGFSTDLGRSAEQLTRQLPAYALSPIDHAWLQIWQRLLTLILSERFTLAQLPDVWRSPYLLGSLRLTDAIAQHCQRDLKAIAVALSHDQTPSFAALPPAQSAFARCFPQAIYNWAITPAQPRLSLLQSQTNPDATLILPFTAALSGAYNGETISNQALKSPQFSPTQLVPLINHFAHQHYQYWSGSLSTSSKLSALASAAPLVMQRRSGLKLVSQQDYDQFS